MYTPHLFIHCSTPNCTLIKLLISYTLYVYCTPTHTPSHIYYTLLIHTHTYPHILYPMQDEVARIAHRLGAKSFIRGEYIIECNAANLVDMGT